MWQAEKTTCIHFSTWHSNLINSQISQDLNLKNVLFFFFCISCWSPVIHGFKIYISDLFVTPPELWDLTRQPLLKTSKTQHSLHQFSHRRLHPYIETYRLPCCKMCAYAVLLYHCFCCFVSWLLTPSLGFDDPMCSHFGRLCTCTFAHCWEITWTTFLSHWQHVLWCCTHTVVTCQKVAMPKNIAYFVIHCGTMILNMSIKYY